MEVTTPVQIRQTNDCEILTFFNANDVEYSLTGDHLFVIHSERGDLRAGPGDWLTVGSDGEVVVEQRRRPSMSCTCGGRSSAPRRTMPSRLLAHADPADEAE